MGGFYGVELLLVIWIWVYEVGRVGGFVKIVFIERVGVGIGIGFIIVVVAVDLEEFDDAGAVGLLLLGGVVVVDDFLLLFLGFLGELVVEGVI